MASWRSDDDGGRQHADGAAAVWLSRIALRLSEAQRALTARARMVRSHLI